MSVWWLGTVLETVGCSLSCCLYPVSARGLLILYCIRTHFTSTHNETPSWSISPAVPPNITMQPVALTPNETTTQCCAGIQVFLEMPDDPTIVFTAQVSTDGTPFTDRSVTREGDVVYVEGLQAGTPYNITLTGRNQFGRVIRDVSTTPLIGERQYILCCMTLIFI